MNTLESLVDKRFEQLGIEEKYQQRAQQYLDDLKSHDKATYNHSLRVGLLSSDAARFLELNEKASFYSGLLHDIGKTVVSTELLQKKTEFTAQDYELIRDHPIIGLRMLTGTFDLTSQIIVRHHTFQDNPYPTDIPISDKIFSKDITANIERYAQVLSMADFYDAITSRHNKKFTCDATILSQDRIIEVYDKFCKEEHKEIFKRLIESEILDRKYLINS